MPKEKINNINIYYEIHGKGEPLLLINGLNSHIGTWSQLLPLLSKHYQVICFDNRGIGRSSAPGQPYTTSEMTRDTIKLLDALDIKTTNILGQSLGGAIAQHIAITQPQRVKKLILVATFAHFNAVSTMVLEARYKCMQNNVATDTLLTVTLPWLYGAKFLSFPENVAFAKNRVLQNPYPQKSYAFWHQAHACITHDTRKNLAKITAPTLIISGEQDLLVANSYTKELIQGINHAKAAVIPDIGHMSMIEAPQELAQLTLSFLAQ